MIPFANGDTHATFSNVQKHISADIEALANDYVLNASLVELEEDFIEKGTIEPLVLRPEERYIDSQTDTKVQSGSDYGRQSVAVAGTKLKIAIPFEGSPLLWQLSGSQRDYAVYPDVELGTGVVMVVQEFRDDSVNADILKKQLDHDIQRLVTGVGYLVEDVLAHNAWVREFVPAALSRKREKALAAVNAVASLGIPIKRIAQTPTYSVPARRRPSPVHRPAVDTKEFEPEPVLDAKEYRHILAIMRSMSLVIERNPASFGALDEEAIRDHFLLQLNGHYEGGATGETFNAAGKTDILIRAGNRNVFIAECKFWHGPKHFDAAIDQLLGYLTWRDSKTALLVFNKNRDTSSVREKMHAAIESRPEWRKTVSCDPLGDSAYVLVKDAEPGREINLTTQLYCLPEASASKP